MCPESFGAAASAIHIGSKLRQLSLWRALLWPRTVTLRRVHTSLRLVEMVARRQVGEVLQMFRAQRRCDVVFLGEPFAEINQLATMRAERRVFVCKPITALLARRAFVPGRSRSIQCLVYFQKHFSFGARLCATAPAAGI